MAEALETGEPLGSASVAGEHRELPNGWAWAEFADICEVVSDDGRKKKLTEYLVDGKYPIIDQGEKVIGGYTNDPIFLQQRVPLIIFGDHTRRFNTGFRQSPDVVE